MALLFAVLLNISIGQAKERPCKPTSEELTVGKLGYQFTAIKRKGKEECVLKLNYIYPDGVSVNWMFTSTGQTTISADRNIKDGWGFLTMQQVLVFPGEKTPQLEILPSEANRVRIHMANGESLLFDTKNGSFLFIESRQKKFTSLDAKHLSTKGMSAEVEKMKKQLDEISPVRYVKYPDKRKITDTEKIENLMDVTEYKGEYLNYGTKFGASPDTISAWKVALVNKLSSGGEKKCNLDASFFFSGGNRDRQDFSSIRLNEAKEECKSQASWTVGEFPQKVPVPATTIEATK